MKKLLTSLAVAGVSLMSVSVFAADATPAPDKTVHHAKHHVKHHARHTQHHVKHVMHKADKANDTTTK